VTAPINLSAAAEEKSSANANMDPRLQALVTRMRSGATKIASASTAENEAAVIARVTDPDAWLSLSEVRDANLIGKADGGSIVTGRIPVSRIEKIRKLPFIESLKAAQPLRRMLAVSTEEAQAQPAQMPAGSHFKGGSGVVVGVIDYGGDFVHRNFRKGDGKTRLLSLWDQNGGNSPASPFGYGVEHSEASLNLAIAQTDPYGAIGYNPGATSHGTHVMDIAAGNGNGTGVLGFAPGADLIFVNVTHDKDPDDAATIIRTSFGDSVTLLEALKYIFTKAGARPAVVNISLGTNGGPHDGTTLVEQGIDALLTAAPNRAVVIAASNSFDDGIHSAGVVAAGGSVDLVWDVAATLLRPIEMELWYDGADRFKVELFAPNGALLATAGPGETKQVLVGSDLAAMVANRLNDPNNHDNMIGVFLMDGLPGGQYVVRLTGQVVSDGKFHAWIERDNSFQSTFADTHDNSHTIGSISCSKKAIAVGSYDANSATKQISYFSSAGPTRDGRQKPEISAPGHNVWAANSLTLTGVTRMSGTSMASPAVTGIVALVFEEAAAQGINLTIDQTIKIITDSARRNPPGGVAWNDRYGFGRVSAVRAIQAVIAMGTGGGGGGGAATGNGHAENAASAPKPRRNAKQTSKTARPKSQ
jgi:hypothetical protein